MLGERGLRVPRYLVSIGVILLLLSEESLVGTFLGALCSYEHSAPTHFG